MLYRRGFMGFGIAAAIVRPSRAQGTIPQMVPVLTRSYDNARSGWNQAEKILTQTNVKLQGIRQAPYNFAMEGDARGGEAQLLIVPNVLTRTGFRQDIAIQASMSDGVWAFNADTGEVLWAVKLGVPITGTVQLDMWKINDNWGILGTPVIDADTNILYCVTWSSPDRSVANARYHAQAINVADGSQAATPIDLTGATFSPGHGLADMALGTVYRKQRTGLLLMNVSGVKHVILAFAAGAESSTDNHGWVIALNTEPFNIAAVWNDSPHYSGGGIWMGAQGPAADAQGNIYLTTGNGAFDGVTDFSETILKLTLTSNGFSVTNSFTPYTDTGRSGLPPTQPSISTMPARPTNLMARMPTGDAPINQSPDQPRATTPAGIVQANNGWTDQDLGSAGLLLIPKYNLVVQCGKDGIVYVLNTNDMGNTKLTDFASPAAIQANYSKLKYAGWFTFFPGYDVSPTPTDLTKLNVDFAQRTHHQHSTPVYYESPVNGPMLFTAGENGPVRAWKVNPNGTLTYLAQSDEVASPGAPVPSGGMTGGMMSVSSNGSAANTGLLIVTFPYGDANKQVSNGFFCVYDPDHFVKRGDNSLKLNPLWRSQDWNINFLFNKFNVPIVSGGKVFIPTYGDHVDVYQLA